MLLTAAITLLHILRPSVSRLTTRPRNVAVDVGGDVTLGCSSDAAARRNGSSWMRFADVGRVELFRGGRRMPGIDKRRFQMGWSETGDRLDLRVRRAHADDAGLYVCSDGEQHASAHLLVVTSSPTCSAAPPPRRESWQPIRCRIV